MGELCEEGANPGEIAARTREAHDKAFLERIGGAVECDRDGRGRQLGRNSGGRASLASVR